LAESGRVRWSWAYWTFEIQRVEEGVMIGHVTELRKELAGRVEKGTVCIIPAEDGGRVTKGGTTVHAVVRTYSGKGAKELFDVLEKQKSDVEIVIRSIKGFVSYTLVRTRDGGLSVSVYQDKAGTEESVQKARDWIKQNAPQAGASAPTVTEGTAILHLK
jgi:hypothetical protein